MIRRKALAGVIEVVGGLDKEQAEQLMRQVYPGPEDKVPYAIFVEHLFRITQEEAEPVLTRPVAAIGADCPGLPNIRTVDLRTVFRCFDVQKLGRLSKEDVATIVHNRDSNQALVELASSVPPLAALLGESTWLDAFHAMDIDSNGVTGWFEFVRFFAFPERPAPIAEATAGGKMIYEDLLAVFVYIDDDRDGQLGREELMHAATVDDAAFRMFQSRVPALKALLHPESWAQSLRALDTDKDGAVSWPEYSRFYRALFKAMPG